MGLQLSTRSEVHSTPKLGLDEIMFFRNKNTGRERERERERERGAELYLFSFIYLNMQICKCDI